MTSYPGQDKEFFIVINDVTTGPLVGLEQLEERGIRPDTPVWYEGLDDWQPAMMAPLTRQLFTPDSEYYRAKAGRAAQQTPADAPVAIETPTRVEPVAATAYEAQQAETPERPRTYLVWAIVVTVLFNLICGVVALVYAIKVKSKYATGNYESSIRCSESAQWWVAVGICVGLIMTVYNLFTGSLFKF